MIIPVSLQRTEITQELSRLYADHQKAWKDATFIGWSPASNAVYEERMQRMGLLRRLLHEVEAAT
jgi:hypothetical protein